MRLVIKGDKRWLKNIVRIQKLFLRLKSDLWFMIYGIQVFTWASLIGQPCLVAFTILVRGGIDTGHRCRRIAHGHGNVMDTGVDAGVVDRQCKWPS